MKIIGLESLVLLSALTICSTVAKAQVTEANWIVTVRDKKTKEIIETANISIGKRTDFPTMEDNRIFVPTSAIKERDSIFVTALGYQPLNISVVIGTAFTDIVSASSFSSILFFLICSPIDTGFSG